jgi:hypothetical protein
MVEYTEGEHFTRTVIPPKQKGPKRPLRVLNGGAGENHDPRTDFVQASRSLFTLKISTRSFSSTGLSKAFWPKATTRISSGLPAVENPA